MPQASDERRDTMRRWFGGEIDSQAPARFLQSHGFALTRQWQWVPPTPHHRVSCYEMECILFLIEEWDFGGLEGGLRSPTQCLCGAGKDKS